MSSRSKETDYENQNVKNIEMILIDPKHEANENSDSDFLVHSFKEESVSEEEIELGETQLDKPCKTSSFQANNRNENEWVTENEDQEMKYNCLSTVVIKEEENEFTQATEGNKERKRSRRPSVSLENERRKHPLIKIEECCSKKCFSLFDEIERISIYVEFWKMHREQRKIWIKDHVSETLAKRKIQDTRRNFTRTYSLPKFDNCERPDILVCQQFFLKTLGYKCTTIIETTLKCYKDDHGNQRVTPRVDQRGRHPPKNKKDLEDAKNHIKSYNPIPSYYKREHANSKLYLPSDLSIKIMHSDYIQKFPHKPVGYELYRKTMSEMNIAFYDVVASNKCEFCIQIDWTTASENPATEEAHQKEVELRTSLYQQDAAITAVDVKVFAVDMPKVFMLPKMPQLQEAFFLSRLLIFKETFAAMQKGEKHHCLLWHEATAGRNAEEVTSSLLKFLDINRDATDIILWLEDCSSQNKNLILFFALLCYINSEFNAIQSITLKYLLTGHTFMTADEQKVRKMGTVQDFSDFFEACQASPQRMCVTQMNFSDFIKLELKEINKKIDCTTLPGLEDLVCVKFVRGEQELLYKSDFRSEEFYRTEGLLKEDALLALSKKNYKKPRGINPSKRLAILEQLVPKMKSSRRVFWINLPRNPDSADILDEGI